MDPLRTLHGEVAPDAHAAAAAKGPEPPAHLGPLRLGRREPATWFPGFGVREHGGAPVQGVGLGGDADAGGERGGTGEGSGFEGGDAGFGAWDRGVQAEGFHEAGVEEGEGVDGLGGGECGGGGGGWEEGGGEGEEFGAEGGLEGGVEGELVEEVAEGYAGCFVAGGPVVLDLGGDLEVLGVGEGVLEGGLVDLVVDEWGGGGGVFLLVGGFGGAEGFRGRSDLAEGPVFEVVGGFADGGGLEELFQYRADAGQLAG